MKLYTSILISSSAPDLDALFEAEFGDRPKVSLLASMQAQMKPKATPALTGKAQPKKAKVMEFRMPRPTVAPPPATAATATAQSSLTGKEADNKATVTREYNFAGETIR